MANLRPTEGGVGPTLKSKEEVNYRQHEACKTCGYYLMSGKCEQVQGNISPEAVCDLWQIREKLPMYKDREYFLNEYEKSKK